MVKNTVEKGLGELDINKSDNSSNNSEGYVNVDPDLNTRMTDTVSVKSTEQWTEEILKDPKVGRHAHLDPDLC